MRGARMDHETRPAVHDDWARRAGTRQGRTGFVRRDQPGGPAHMRGHAVPVEAPRRGAVDVDPGIRSRATALRIRDERVRRDLSEWVIAAVLVIGVFAASIGLSWILQVMAGLR